MPYGQLRVRLRLRLLPQLAADGKRKRGRRKGVGGPRASDAGFAHRKNTTPRLVNRGAFRYNVRGEDSRTQGGHDVDHEPSRGGDSLRENARNQCDGLWLLRQIEACSLKVVFFDPQYRGVLDKLAYGNEGKNRGKRRAALAQMSEETILAFLLEIERVLRPSGYLFLWVDKFHLIEGVAPWFAGTSLETVDMITWNKMKIGMGYRTRRKSEYLVVVQKRPKLARATWRLHDIPDVWEERVAKTHAHSKPVELQKRLILATTDEDDLVCDPAAGGYSVLEACLLTGRRFIGGDIELFGEGDGCA